MNIFLQNKRKEMLRAKERREKRKGGRKKEERRKEEKKREEKREIIIIDRMILQDFWVSCNKYLVIIILLFLCEFLNLLCYNQYFPLEREGRNTENRGEEKRRENDKEQEENENGENGNHLYNYYS